MTCTSISASMTHAFDPAAWLAQFETVGGGWIVRDCLSLAILVEGRTDAQISQARMMIVALTTGDREALVKHLRRGVEAGEG